MRGFVVWFTGLSGAGKSTLGAMLAAELRHRGVAVEVLDGDEVRTHLSRGLGFSREDRDVNVRRIGFVAKLVARAGGCAITAAISPYRSIRDEQRAQIGRFVEVFVQCSLPVLAERDPKGLYKKALAGEIKHFTGIDDPYEAPERPEVTVDTGVETKEESLARILARLEELGYVAAGAGARAGRALVAPHGGDLVDRFAHGAEREALLASAPALPVLDLDARAERDLTLLATGAFSPLKGFMGEKDFLRVRREMRLENGLPWPVPITLAVPEASAVAVGSRAALRARDGRLVAVIDVSDRFARAPGGRPCVGGEVHVLERPTAPAAPAHHHDPREARALFAARGWSRVVGYGPGGPMLRAQEHLTKSALESADGLFVQAALTPDLAVMLRCHEALVAGYYPPGRVVLSVSPDAPRPPGARALLLAALVAKNHGVSHVIVERDAGSSAVFERFAPAELGVVPLVYDAPFYSRITRAMATRRTAPGGPSTRLRLRGTTFLAALARGERPSPQVVRPEVADVLIEGWRLHE
jgi:sulfate adenylyltransferase/3'-phosphoadenosine 5'-phosphosulfate synthase